ncbi:hypothetical protein [Mesorhizobium sp. B2-1-2]|uniref:hypothetical protein n=1 Tax=Mesorhizobium sp. B2-1-2 TaxID=2589973 RepID=UPI001747A6B0|nr:hypothetical protein [Mesorhizobium sp. B2-1-2]
MEDQIEKMAQRFLTWRLPENFSPDGGITFEKTFNEHTAFPMQHTPTGTNLFDATQATAMVRHMLEGLAHTAKRCDYCKEHGFQAPNLCEDCRSPPATKGVTEALRRIASLRYAEDADVYDTLEEALSIADTALASLSPLPAPGEGEATEVSIKPMHLSDDRCDYFVSIQHGDREVTPHVFRERFKAEYHVALYRWVLCQSDKPDIMKFDEGDWPAREYTAEERRAFDGWQPIEPEGWFLDRANHGHTRIVYNGDKHEPLPHAEGPWTVEFQRLPYGGRLTGARGKTFREAWENACAAVAWREGA